jgi:PIN domain nuclease of toxin-antitoxin system
MPGLVVDTHALIWYLTASPRLSRSALTRMEATIAAGDGVYVPSISLVEITYLIEKGRLPPVAAERIAERLSQPDSGLLVAPLDKNVAEHVGKIPREQIPDMPDRIIAATALRLGLPLVTKDGRIRSGAIETLW